MRTRMTLGGLALLLLATAVPAAGYERPGRTERVSVLSDGSEVVSPSNINAWVPTISRDGRYVAFESFSPGFHPEGEAWVSILVHDRATGETRRLDAEGDGTAGPMRFSADARFLVFSTFSSRNVPGDTNGFGDIFVYDLATDEQEMVSMGYDGSQANEDSIWPTISADGRYVAYSSRASNIVPEDTKAPGQRYDAYVHDRETGETERVSLASDGSEISGNPLASTLSADGRYVAFSSNASNLVPGDTNMTSDVFVVDRVTRQVERVSVATDGTEGNGGSGISHGPSISDDGRFVAFDSQASNLVPVDMNTASDVFVHDRLTGRTERVSVASDGAEARPRRLPTQTSGSYLPDQGAMTPDGRYVLFYSDASNLGPIDDPRAPFSLFLHDRETGTTETVSLSHTGVPANATTDGGVVSADGSVVAMDTVASNLNPEGDTNGDTDVFTRDRGPAIGVGLLTATVSGDAATVSGWASFSGGAVTSGTDPRGDAVVPNLGHDLVGAAIAQRPESGELQVRFEVDRIHGVDSPRPQGCQFGTCQPSQGGAPGILFQMAFTLDGVPYEVRATGAVGVREAQIFEVYRCNPTCVTLGSVDGDLGGTGSRVVVEVPYALLAFDGDGPLERVRATTTAGATAGGTLTPIDEMNLVAGHVSAPTLEVGIVPDDAPPGALGITSAATLNDGSFQELLPTSTLGPGPYRVWARACLGGLCGDRSIVVPPG